MGGEYTNFSNLNVVGMAVIWKLASGTGIRRRKNGSQVAGIQARRKIGSTSIGIRWSREGGGVLEECEKHSDNTSALSIMPTSDGVTREQSPISHTRMSSPIPRYKGIRDNLVGGGERKEGSKKA